VRTALEHWQDKVAPDKASQSANTRALNERNIRLYLVPGLGRIRLDKLTFTDFNRWQADIARGTYSTRPLSRSTTLSARKTLSQVLKFADSMDWIARNPLQFADSPGGRPAQHARNLAVEELSRFFAACVQHRLGAACMLNMLTGMRKGEVLGLTWSDVDFEHCQIRLTRQLVRETREKRTEWESKTHVVLKGLKSKKGTDFCMLALPDFACEILQAHRKRSREEQMAYGRPWAPQPAEGVLVFHNPEGVFCDPDNFGKVTPAIMAAANLEHTSTHGLRHTCASLLFDNGEGVDLKVISEQLGHPDTRTPGHPSTSTCTPTRERPVPWPTSWTTSSRGHDDDRGGVCSAATGDAGRWLTRLHVLQRLFGVDYIETQNHQPGSQP
jgi:integrase